MSIVLLLSLLSIVYSINDQCTSATVVDLTLQEEFTTTEDTTVTPLSSARVGTQVREMHGKWYRVETAGLGNKIEIDTCILGNTNYNSKIMVFSSCSDGVGTNLVTMNDDSFAGCGSAARLLMSDIKKRSFYVFVTGSEVSDVGVFGLMIRLLPPPENTQCPKAIEIKDFPKYVEAVTTGIPPNYHGLSGVFYHFRGNGKRIHIGTCHRATNVDTVVNVFDGCESMNVIPTDHTACSDGNMGSKVHVDTIVGKEYFIHLASSPKKRGMFIAYFELESLFVPMNCNKASAITQLPYAHTTTLDGEVQSMSCGNTLQKTGAWYSIMGDGYDYIMYTCNSMNGPQDGTVIEVFESCESNSRCEMNDNGCGLHGKISKRLETGKNYFIKVSCANPHSKCRVTLNVDKLNTQGDINTCVFGKAVNVESFDDVFTDAFDVSRARKIETKCGGSNTQRGVWYKVQNKMKYAFPLFVQSNVILASSNKHTAEIQMYRSCSLECEERQQSVHRVTLKPQETVMIFITAPQDEGQMSVYMRRDFNQQHDTCKTAIEFNAPFSLVEYKSNLGMKTTPVCAGNVVGRHTGIYYYFQSPVTDTMVVETCGLETQFDTYVEVFQGCGSDATCVLSNDDAPECGSSASYVKFEAQQGAEYYIYISEASKATDTEGTFRLNVYTLIPPTHSTCQRAENLTPGLTQYALTKYAFDSVSNCNLNERRDISSLTYGSISKKQKSKQHLKGVWYKYTATVLGKLHVNTCNAATSVRTRMGIYKSCGVQNDISYPDQCVIENTVSYQSCSTRGTYVSVNLNAGETVFVFVGGETDRDVGFVAVDSDFQTSAPEFKRIVYTPRVGPRRLKERRTLWFLWAFWLFFYSAMCLIVFGVLKYFGKKDDFLGYHEL
ncbi:hypothetical protein EIN_178390 [Entamoeba invadens IP1]|uniref:hypothetical protein n=1 Tax=Entamoeba invadens IP1 TaxID=370355 RepID=UPI0002C3E0D0|nr:hypothetical protein EIN_178390 [Entamoeba invadens IP1]ELP93902.1 hypothetical protein EIN_178390 [Entamoeba invadens IP1]|eukprot:XP_004260673.1 hypothetical protein EIN_178390 [Entamoeba invadens IP1]